jgi:hypothetical protein
MADNLLRTWQLDVRDAGVVALNLISILQELFEKCVRPDENGEGNIFDIEQAVKSCEYKAYLNAVCELEKVNIMCLSVYQRVSFFLNVFQCMYAHYFIK